MRGIPRALRDLVLIVLGVLLALAADSWRESRQDRRTEVALLGAMRAAIANDRVALESAIDGFERAEAANLSLQHHLAAAEPYRPDLDSLFGQVYATGVAPPLNVAAYEALKAQGLQIIQDEPLRLRIVELYENTYGAVRRQNDFNVGVVFDVLRPYYLAHFRDLQFGVTAKPLDYEALRVDPLYMNMLVYRADFVRRAVIEYYSDAVFAIDSLAAAMDAEIGSR